MNQPLTEDEIRAFVGPRADYYLGKWAEHHMGFNGAAFLLSGFWLPYRKMYLAAVLLYVLILVESVLEDVVFIGLLGKADSPGWLSRAVALGVACACGILGNRLYYAHARSKIRRLRKQGLTDQAYLQALAEQGGTSMVAALGMFCVFIVLVVAAVLATGFALGQ